MHLGCAEQGGNAAGMAGWGACHDGGVPVFWQHQELVKTGWPLGLPIQ